MADFCPAARLDPGADWYMNVSRQFVPRGLVVHTTQGHDSRGLLKTRHHVSPGTVQYLIHAGELICYYPDDVRCSHAAGANMGTTGCEIDMFTGEPLAPADAACLSVLADYHSKKWGWDRALYVTGDPRVWVDQSTFRGAIAHRGVAYPPDRSLLHFDQITPAEWPIGASSDDDAEGDDSMLLGTIDGQTYYLFVWARGVTQVTAGFVAFYKGPRTILTQQDYDVLKTYCSR